jgi:hypothetical protein
MPTNWSSSRGEPSSDPSSPTDVAIASVSRRELYAAAITSRSSVVELGRCHGVQHHELRTQYRRVGRRRQRIGPGERLGERRGSCR